MQDTIKEQLEWNKKFPPKNSLALVDCGVRLSISAVDDFTFGTGDELTGIEYRLYVLKEFLRIFSEKPKSLVSRKNSSLNKFFVIETFSAMILLKKIQNDLLKDFSKDLEDIGNLIGNNDNLMRTAMHHGLDVNWLIFNNIPDDILEIEKELFINGYLR